MEPVRDIQYHAGKKTLTFQKGGNSGGKVCTISCKSLNGVLHFPLNNICHWQQEFQMPEYVHVQHLLHQQNFKFHLSTLYFLLTIKKKLKKKKRKKNCKRIVWKESKFLHANIHFQLEIHDPCYIYWQV
jgi:hypothetical protein